MTSGQLFNQALFLLQLSDVETQFCLIELILVD